MSRCKMANRMTESRELSLLRGHVINTHVHTYASVGYVGASFNVVIKIIKQI